MKELGEMIVCLLMVAIFIGGPLLLVTYPLQTEAALPLHVLRPQRDRSARDRLHAQRPGLPYGTCMTGVEHLKIVQDRLIARGVRDVKFTLAPGIIDVDKICGDLARFLEAYLDGRTKLIWDSEHPELGGIGDAP